MVDSTVRMARAVVEAGRASPGTAVPVPDLKPDTVLAIEQAVTAGDTRRILAMEAPSGAMKSGSQPNWLAGPLITPELILSAYGAAYRYAEAKRQAGLCRTELTEHVERMQAELQGHEATMEAALQELRELGVEEDATLERLEVRRHGLSLRTEDDPAGAA